MQQLTPPARTRAGLSRSTTIRRGLAAATAASIAALA
ncbi:MAG: hypothetical protein JWQ18_2305, partial [Conexibacter sp.]|nr:hypothetical protein [Conexibacter sp.]